MERRPTHRFHAGASDPDQPADRGDAEGCAALPAVGSGARSARPSRRLVRERGWRNRHAGEIIDSLFSSWPGLSRPSTSFLRKQSQDVDARHANKFTQSAQGRLLWPGITNFALKAPGDDNPPTASSRTSFVTHDYAA